MPEQRSQRLQLRELADRLILEYAGAVPPGQVLAAVFRANHALDGHVGPDGDTRVLLCEAFVRRQLTSHLASHRPGSIAAVPSQLATGSLAS